MFGPEGKPVFLFVFFAILQIICILKHNRTAKAHTYFCLVITCTQIHLLLLDLLRPQLFYLSLLYEHLIPENAYGHADATLITFILISCFCKSLMISRNCKDWLHSQSEGIRFVSEAQPYREIKPCRNNSWTEITVWLYCFVTFCNVVTVQIANPEDKNS